MKMLLTEEVDMQLGAQNGGHYPTTSVYYN